MKRLKLLALVVGVIALGLVVAVYRLTHRALPVIDGTLRVQGLEGQAEIIRDRRGIPHIFADRDADASFALGFDKAAGHTFTLDQDDILAGPNVFVLVPRAHGSARLTQDLDVVYARDEANVARLVESLAPLRPFGLDCRSLGLERDR